MGAVIQVRRPKARINVTDPMSTQKNTTVLARSAFASAIMESMGMTMDTAPATSPSVMPSFA